MLQNVDIPNSCDVILSEKQNVEAITDPNLEILQYLVKNQSISLLPVAASFTPYAASNLTWLTRRRRRCQRSSFPLRTFGVRRIARALELLAFAYAHTVHTYLMPRVFVTRAMTLPRSRSFAHMGHGASTFSQNVHQMELEKEKLWLNVEFTETSEAKQCRFGILKNEEERRFFTRVNPRPRNVKQWLVDDKLQQNMIPYSTVDNIWHILLCNGRDVKGCRGSWLKIAPGERFWRE